MPNVFTMTRLRSILDKTPWLWRVGNYLPIVNYVLKLDGIDIDPGLRSRMLNKLANEEEGLEFDEIRFDAFLSVLLYPRSYLNQVNELPTDKIHDYNFVGCLYKQHTFESRKWIIDFAKVNFTDHSYYCITDPINDYQPIGNFDFSLEQAGKRFVPKQNNRDHNQVFFDVDFFRTMKQSKFTLCPSGDAPWSLRFFEAIMCKSIPVLEKTLHSGRNNKERKIGYRYYLTDEEHLFREEWAEENYQRFLVAQTLTNRASSDHSFR